MASISVSPKPVAGSVTLDAIPDQVKTDVEEIWKLLQANAEQDVRVEESDWTIATENEKDYTVVNSVTEEAKTLHKGANAKAEAEAEAMALNKAAVLKWLRDAKSYGEQRMDEAGNSAKLKVFALPKRNLPDNIKYISVKRDVPGDAAANTHQTSR